MDLTIVNEYHLREYFCNVRKATVFTIAKESPF